MGDGTGYSKEKADRMIKEHERKAKELEDEAVEKRRTANPFSLGKEHAKSYAGDLEAEAKSERQKAENLKELKKHWGDK